MPSPKEHQQDKLSAVVYKISQDKNLGKLAYIRLYSGSMHSRDEIYNHTKGINEKLTQIKKVQGLKTLDCGEAYGGEFACVSGMPSVSIGDVLGSPDFVPKAPSIANPLLTLQVFSKYV